MRMCRGFIPLMAALAVCPAARADGPKAQIVVGKKQIDLKSGGAVVASYVIDPSAAKPYFWPMNALPGASVTRAWPINDSEKLTAKEKDHVHHRSAWFCHGDVIPEGVEFKKHFRDVAGVDFWSERKGHGKIVCTKVDKPSHDEKAGRASVTTHNEWTTAEGLVILEEVRTIHLIHLGANRHLIVLDIDLHASQCPITFGDTKEGSFAVRVKQSVQVQKPGRGTMVNAEGLSGGGRGLNKDKKGAWGLVSDWVDYSGPVDGDKVAGVALFADAKNRIDTAWHARDYGLLAANPFARARSGFPGRTDHELVKLKKGEHLKLRYAFYLHAGDVKEGKVAEAFATFKKLGGR